MICEYCQKECEYMSNGDYYNCDNHGESAVNYKIELSKIYKTLVLKSKFFKDKNIIYYCTFLTQQNNKIFTIKQWSRRLTSSKIIVELDFHPNITPENYLDKIKKYILFS